MSQEGTMTYYKVLHEDGRAFHGGKGSWHLSKGSKPGKWMPKIENIKPCRSGYHVCELGDLLSWLGPAIFEVEIRGETIRHDTKTVVQQARLMRRTAWDGKIAASFALDCAQHALNREKRAGHTPDKRLYDAIKVSRRYLKGTATLGEVRSAAGSARSAASAASAARSAAPARSAAWSTARSAASAARSAKSAASAAESAMWSAWSAAWSNAVSSTIPVATTWSASRSEEIRWQQKRLLEYVTGERTL